MGDTVSGAFIIMFYINYETGGIKIFCFVLFYMRYI